MKVSVYRRNGADGYTEPVVCLGEDKPTGEGWFINAKAEVSDAAHPPKLLLLGRAFLIYSMYHAREPRYLGYAVENFGAAVQKLGYSLPLGEQDASWLTYGTDGLDPGSPADYQFLFAHIARVFGVKAAQEQATALGMKWPSRIKAGPTDKGYSRN